MTPEDVVVTALAFPKHHADRERLRQLLQPIPSLYPDGIERPCSGCGMVLDVGPRLVARGYHVLVCPWCLAAAIGQGAQVGEPINLGNPDSKCEDPHQ